MTRLEDLAVRLDKIARGHDPFDYEDNGGSVEEAMNSLTLDPVGVIEYLVGMIEDLA